MKSKQYIFKLLFFAAILCLPFTAKAQVVIGDASPPQPFSALELISNQAGLRLPQMNNAQRTALQATFGAEAQGAARGLQIFNTQTGCVEVWNGTHWISLCDDLPHCNLAITAHIPASLTTTVTTGNNPNLRVQATSTGTRTYRWYRNSTNSNTGGTFIEGQTSAALTGQTELTVAGSPYFFYVTVTAVCEHGFTSTVTSEVFTVEVIDLSGIQIGSGTLGGRTCFDVGQTTCMQLAPANRRVADFTNRTPQTLTAAPPFSGVQTYTFTAVGTVTNVRFLIEDFANVIDPAAPLSGHLANALGNNQTVNFNVAFASDLNSRFAGQQDRTVRAVIHVIFHDGADYRRISRSISIRDCACCGARVSSNDWREFMCHNLGADYSLNPFVPSPQIIGNMYLWGIGVPIMMQNEHIANNGPVTGTPWLERATPPIQVPGDNFWPMPSDGSLPNPCPAGFRVPTPAEWAGLGSSVWNPRTNIGVLSRLTPGLSGVMIGPDLFLPHAGLRHGALWIFGLETSEDGWMNGTYLSDFSRTWDNPSMQWDARVFRLDAFRTVMVNGAMIIRWPSILSETPGPKTHQGAASVRCIAVD